MTKLIIATSKKTGNKYAAIALCINGKTTFMTFDKQAIVKALDIRYSDLESLACGEYIINEKGVEL